MSKSSSSSDGLLSQHSHICPPPSCVRPRTQKEAVSKERTIPKGKMKKKGGTSGVGYGSGTRKRRGGGADTRLGTRTKGNVLKLIKPNKKNLNTVLMFLTI
jgi:hypothetical protein